MELKLVFHRSSPGWATVCPFVLRVRVHPDQTLLAQNRVLLELSVDSRQSSCASSASPLAWQKQKLFITTAPSRSYDSVVVQRLARVVELTVARDQVRVQHLHRAV
jgi:hypothetical protein